MGSSRFRSIAVIFLLIVTVVLAAVAIYVGYQLQQEDQGAEPAAAAGWVLKHDKPDCDNTGCECKDDRGCQIYWYNCPDGWDDGICLRNEVKWGELQKGDRMEYTAITGGIDCTYLQIDMSNIGHHNPRDGNLGYALFEWDDFSVCDMPPTGGCGDNWCSVWERANNRCEMRTWSTATTAVPWSCADNEKIAECRSDCTWCGDGTVQSNHEEECDPGGEPSSTCDANCKSIVTPSGVTCGEDCETDSDCDQTGTVCNGDLISDVRYPNGTCILETCADSLTDCASDGCSLIDVPAPIQPQLPKTAIIDDQGDKILVAVIAIIVGVLLFKFDAMRMVRNVYKGIKDRFQTGKLAYLTAPFSERSKQVITDKKKKKIESRFS